MSNDAGTRAKPGPPTKDYYVGVDLGQKRDHTRLLHRPNRCWRGLCRERSEVRFEERTRNSADDAAEAGSDDLPEAGHAGKEATHSQRQRTGERDERRDLGTNISWQDEVLPSIRDPRRQAMGSWTSCVWR